MGTLLRAYQRLCRAGHIQYDPLQEEAVKQLQQLFDRLIEARNTSNTSLWRKLFRQPRPLMDTQGVYLYGGVGRGKSMLMDLLYQQISPLIASQRVHFHAFMKGVHEKLEELRKQEIDDPLPLVAKDIAAENTLLCFDEFFVRDIADAMILGRLFQELFARGLCIVATSNSAIPDLYADGLQRAQFLPFIAIFQEKLVEFALDGPTDYRKLSLSNLKHYYQKDTEQQDFAKAFYASIQHLPNTPLTITVYGRALYFSHHYRGVLRCNFQELCGIPLAANDYLALVAHISVLFLADMPKLDDPEREAEARRFLYLIDCLYEEKCSLFFVSESPLEALYTMGRLHAEFRRAESRLHEMQSSAYLDLAKTI